MGLFWHLRLRPLSKAPPHHLNPLGSFRGEILPVTGLSWRCHLRAPLVEGQRGRPRRRPILSTIAKAAQIVPPILQVPRLFLDLASCLAKLPNLFEGHLIRLQRREGLRGLELGKARSRQQKLRHLA